MSSTYDLQVSHSSRTLSTISIKGSFGVAGFTGVLMMVLDGLIVVVLGLGLLVGLLVRGFGVGVVVVFLSILARNWII